MNSTTPQSMSDLPELPNELVRVGGLLSNAAYNLAQHADLSPEMRESLDKLRKQWDAARTEYGRLCRATAEQAGKVEGAVVLTGWTKADGKTLWMCHDGMPVFNEGKHGDLGTNKAIHLTFAKPSQPAAPGEPSPCPKCKAAGDTFACQRCGQLVTLAAPVSPSREVEALAIDRDMVLRAARGYWSTDTFPVGADPGTERRHIERIRYALMDALAPLLAPVQEKSP